MTIRVQSIKSISSIFRSIGRSISHPWGSKNIMIGRNVVLVFGKILGAIKFQILMNLDSQDLEGILLDSQMSHFDI